MVVKGDTVITESLKVGVVVTISSCKETLNYSPIGNVFGVRFSHDPGNINIFVLEPGGYNFCVNGGNTISKVTRNKEIVYESR